MDEERTWQSRTTRKKREPLCLRLYRRTAAPLLTIPRMFGEMLCFPLCTCGDSSVHKGRESGAAYLGRVDGRPLSKARSFTSRRERRWEAPK